jgi:hypothetical protein
MAYYVWVNGVPTEVQQSSSTATTGTAYTSSGSVSVNIPQPAAQSSSSGGSALSTMLAQASATGEAQGQPITNYSYVGPETSYQRLEGTTKDTGCRLYNVTSPEGQTSQQYLTTKQVAEAKQPLINYLPSNMLTPEQQPVARYGGASILEQRAYDYRRQQDIKATEDYYNKAPLYEKAGMALSTFSSPAGVEFITIPITGAKPSEIIGRRIYETQEQRELAREEMKEGMFNYTTKSILNLNPSLTRDFSTNTGIPFIKTNPTTGGAFGLQQSLLSPPSRLASSYLVFRGAGGIVKEAGVIVAPKIAGALTSVAGPLTAKEITTLSVGSKVIGAELLAGTGAIIGVGTLQTYQQAKAAGLTEAEATSKAAQFGGGATIELIGAFRGFSTGIQAGLPRRWEFVAPKEDIKNIVAPSVLSGTEAFATIRGGEKAMLKLASAESGWPFKKIPQPAEFNNLKIFSHATGEVGAFPKGINKINIAPDIELRPTDMGGLYVSTGQRLSASMLRVGSPSAPSNAYPPKVSLFSKPQAIYVGYKNLPEALPKNIKTIQAARDFTRSGAKEAQLYTTIATRLGKSEIEYIQPGGAIDVGSIAGRTTYKGFNIPIRLARAVKNSNLPADKTVNQIGLRDYISNFNQVRSEAKTASSFATSSKPTSPLKSYINKSLMVRSTTSSIPKSSTISVGRSLMASSPTSSMPRSSTDYSTTSSPPRSTTSSITRSKPPSSPPTSSIKPSTTKLPPSILYLPYSTKGNIQKEIKKKRRTSTMNIPSQTRSRAYSDWYNVNRTELGLFKQGKPFKAYQISNAPEVQSKYKAAYSMGGMFVPTANQPQARKTKKVINYGNFR